MAEEVINREELVERWANIIIPCVFKAEDEVILKHPEWRERLRNIDPKEVSALAAEYCRAIAEEIIYMGGIGVREKQH